MILLVNWILSPFFVFEPQPVELQEETNTLSMKSSWVSRPTIAAWPAEFSVSFSPAREKKKKTTNTAATAPTMGRPKSETLLSYAAGFCVRGKEETHSPSSLSSLFFFFFSCV
jgi:hypothetical protein